MRAKKAKDPHTDEERFNWALGVLARACQCQPEKMLRCEFCRISDVLRNSRLRFEKVRDDLNELAKATID